jgi:FtsX-like permease family
LRPLFSASVSSVEPSSITSRQVPVLVAVLVALLGAAAAAHALVLGVRRRSHDFAVLRALGLRPRQASAVVYWQAGILALVAVVAGVPLGVLLGRLVWTAIAQPSNVLVRIDVLVPGLALLAAAVMVLALTLSIWPANRATRLRQPRFGGANDELPLVTGTDPLAAAVPTRTKAVQVGAEAHVAPRSISHASAAGRSLTWRCGGLHP